MNTVASYNCKCRNGYSSDGKVCEKSFLVISSYETRDWTTVNAKWVQKWKPAITFGLSEEIGQFECFDKDTKSQAEDSVCSLTWKNRMHIFGGVANSNGGHSSYISRLNGFKLEYLKSLSFSFTHG